MGYESLHVRAERNTSCYYERKEAAGSTPMGNAEETRELIGKTGRGSADVAAVKERETEAACTPGPRARRALVHAGSSCTKARTRRDRLRRFIKGPHPARGNG